MNLKDDKKIIDRLKRHDETALNEIMNEYLPLVSSIIYNIGRGSLTAEDIEEAAMDTFITLWKNCKKIQYGSLRGYICTISKTKAFDKLDSVRKNITVDIDEFGCAAEDGFSIEYRLEQADANEILYRIIQALDPQDREIVIRYYYYYQRIGVIADYMGISIDNVKVRLHRARVRIKKLIVQGGYKL